MFENIVNFFKKIGKKEQNKESSKDTAKERLHLVLMQDRANVSVDFLELMKQEIIEVIKKYIEVDEKEIDVRLTNKENEDGTNGAPALYANIPILTIKNETRKIDKKEVQENRKQNEEKNIEENIKENKKQNKEERIEENIEKIQKDKSKEVEKQEGEITDNENIENEEKIEEKQMVVEQVKSE